MKAKLVKAIDLMVSIITASCILGSAVLVGADLYPRNSASLLSRWIIIMFLAAAFVIMLFPHSLLLPRAKAPLRYGAIAYVMCTVYFLGVVFSPSLRIVLALGLACLFFAAARSLSRGTKQAASPLGND